MKKIRRYRLVIVDEVGFVPFAQDPANLFFQLVASRYEQGSMMVTSNLPFGCWEETFSDDVVAAAMMDRLVHHPEVLTLTGDSYRTWQRREFIDTRPRPRPARVVERRYCAASQPGAQIAAVDRGLYNNAIFVGDLAAELIEEHAVAARARPWLLDAGWAQRTHYGLIFGDHCGNLEARGTRFCRMASATSRSGTVEDHPLRGARVPFGVQIVMSGGLTLIDDGVEVAAQGYEKRCGTVEFATVGEGDTTDGADLTVGVR